MLGDRLTDERVQTAQKAMANAETQLQRLQGFVSKIEDFHRLMNFLEVSIAFLIDKNKLYTMHVPLSFGIYLTIRYIICNFMFLFNKYKSMNLHLVIFKYRTLRLTALWLDSNGCFIFRQYTSWHIPPRVLWTEARFITTGMICILNLCVLHCLNVNYACLDLNHAHYIVEIY